MAEAERISAILQELNAALGDVTPYKLALVDPAEVLPVDVNVHYMPKRTYDQLVGNIKRDSNLSTLPFCWRAPDGKMVSLSGNHRMMAARDAAVSQVLVLYTDDDLSRPEQLAIQLSHNALVGEDNPTTLKDLWLQIDDLHLKVYSGLDDGLLETMPPAEAQLINDAGLLFEEVAIFFVQPEGAELERVAKKLGKVNRRRFLADYKDFDAFFDALLNYKETAGIVSTATAMVGMTEIVNDWLEHNAGEREP